MSLFPYSTYLTTILLFVLLQFQSEIALSQTSIEFFKENEKTGIKDQTGKIVVPAKYDQLGWSEGFNLPVDGVIGYYKNGWGLLSTKNKIITSPRYYSLEAHHKNLIVASVKGRFSNELLYGVINSKGQVIVDFKYHSLIPNRDLIIVSERREGKSYYGLVGQNGSSILRTQFSDISYFKNDLYIFTTDDNKKGIIHSNGIIKIESSLDSISPASKSYSLIYQSGKVGAIDSTGLIMHSPHYKRIISAEEVVDFKHYQLYDASHRHLKSFYCDSLFELSEDLLVVVRNGFYEILNNHFESIYRGQFLEKLSAYRKNIIFRRENKSHIIKFNGQPVNSRGFDSLRFDQNYIYGQINGEWQVFNKFGSNLSKWSFDSLITTSNNLIPVKRNRYWGYIDHSGRIAIPIKFDGVGAFVGNMAEVNYLGSRRIINQFGEFIGQLEYDQVTIEKANSALVTKHGRTDLINYRGGVLFQTFNKLKPNFFGYLELTADGKVGLVSHLGEVILHPIYDSISSPINRRYVVVKQGNKTGLANFKGFWILPLSEETQDICHVSDGLISIKKNGQYGYVDFGRKLLIANRYEKTKPFTAQLAAVKLNNRWGFIDKKERLVIQPTYDDVTPFRNGISLVQRNSKLGAINPDGSEKIKIVYDSISTTTHEFLLARREEKFGLFNQLGDVLLQPLYTKIRPTMDDHFIVERRGLHGLIDSSGRYSIPLKYFNIHEISNGRYICLETGKGEVE